MRLPKLITYLAVVLGAALLTAFMTVLYTRPYKGIVGNLCSQTPENPYGYCYEMLPSGGFPFAFLWDNGGVSVVGRLSWIEDDFALAPFLANVSIYLVIYAILFGVLARRKNRPK